MLRWAILTVNKNYRAIVTTLAVIVVFAGIGYSFLLGSELRYSDEHEYCDIGKNITTRCTVSLDGRERTALRPPGYWS